MLSLANNPIMLSVVMLKVIMLSRETLLLVLICLDQLLLILKILYTFLTKQAT